MHISSYHFFLTYTTCVLVYMYHESNIMGPASSVTIGPDPSIIRDTITVTQPQDYIGDVGIIQKELSALGSIDTVTVSVVNSSPDDLGYCSWRVTFDFNAGDLPGLEVAAIGSDNFLSTVLLDTGDTVSVIDDFVKGTSEPISGHFSVSYRGDQTPYLPHNVSSMELTAALENLSPKFVRYI